MDVSSNARGNAQRMLGAIHATNATYERNVRVQDSDENPCVPDPRNPVDNPKFDRFIILDNAGWSARRIAEDLDINPRTVSRWRVISGRVKRVVRGTLPASDHDRVRELVEDGASISEAARTVGVDPSTAYRWFPDLPRWTPPERGRHAVAVREFNRIAA
ncbi:helix-turn-helix domain-containing protein [Microbacterium testaceum]|uniref:helix-turn-helix domain-containing protein n=1 Tax=Microbacterium testaceum TaxID=2033 RepID=UPI000A76BFA2|nr:helix-turn-helix domain-containing protein [Microbacterium testaceum]